MPSNDRDGIMPDLVRRMMDAKRELELPASGVSMFPVIREGDICRFRPWMANGSSRGDIVLFEDGGGRLVAHRLYRQEGSGEELRYICKGDANLSCDDPVVEKSMIGVLTAIRRGDRILKPDDMILRIWCSAMLRIPGISLGIQIFLKRRM